MTSPSAPLAFWGRRASDAPTCDEADLDGFFFILFQSSRLSRYYSLVSQLSLSLSYRAPSKRSDTQTSAPRPLFALARRRWRSATCRSFGRVRGAVDDALCHARRAAARRARSDAGRAAPATSLSGCSPHTLAPAGKRSGKGPFGRSCVSKASLGETDAAAAGRYEAGSSCAADVDAASGSPATSADVRAALSTSSGERGCRGGE